MTAVKTLYALSGNLCFYTGCEEQLTNPRWREVQGETAHIKGERPVSARYDPLQTERERQAFDNLMLLCPKHHKEIDRLCPDDHPVELLLEMKRKHLDHAGTIVWPAACDEALLLRFAQETIAYAVATQAREGDHRQGSASGATVTGTGTAELSVTAAHAMATNPVGAADQAAAAAPVRGATDRAAAADQAAAGRTVSAGKAHEVDVTDQIDSTDSAEAVVAAGTGQETEPPPAT